MEKKVMEKVKTLKKEEIPEEKKEKRTPGQKFVAAVALAALFVVIIVMLAIKAIGLESENDRLKSELICYKEKSVRSVTFDELDKRNKLKVEKYILHRHKRIPTPVANLTAKNIVEFAQAFNLPISVIVGVTEVESAFNPSQVSNKNARGLMQVRWSVWKEELKKEDGFKSEFELHEIDKGIKAGVIVLKHYIEKNDGDMSKALYDYVGGSEDYSIKVYKAMGKFMLYE